MPDDLNAPIENAERMAALRQMPHFSAWSQPVREVDVVSWANSQSESYRAFMVTLDALCLARRRERALREAIEAAKRDCPACEGTGTLVSQNSEINGCGCGQCADFDRALAATDSAKGER